MVPFPTSFFDLGLLGQRRLRVCGILSLISMSAWAALMSMMATYRLSLSLPLRQGYVNLGIVRACVSLAIEDNNVLATHDIDTRLDDDVKIYIPLRGGLVLSLCHWPKYATDGLLEHDRLFYRRGGSEGNIVAMAYDAIGGVDGDALLGCWLLAHGSDCCRRPWRR